MSCLFCEMVDGNIGCEKVYEDDYYIVINDINPIAPKHMLIIPKVHMDNCAGLGDAPELSSRIFLIADKVAQQSGMEKGYRIVTNNGQDAGQSVQHLHFHLLGGKSLDWKKL